MKGVEIVIIGGGIHGCAIAYNLACRGMTDVLLLEKDFLASGGTGRSAAGIRHQFGTRINCLLARESIKIWENLAEELQHPELDFVQDGYLMLAYSQSQAEQLKKNIELQHSLGVHDSVFLSLDELAELFPHLALEDVLGASFNPRDGHADPFQASWAYARAAERRGVEIRTSTPVHSLEECQGGYKLITGSGEELMAKKVVNAAGPWGKMLAAQLGVEVPLYPERHQIMVTEPVNRIQRAMVISFEHCVYFKQTPHGSFLIGLGDSQEIRELRQSSSWQFLKKVTERVVNTMPLLRKMRLVRQWAGLYDITPDQQAILGEVEGKEGFYLDLGWSGHGFQLAPIIGRLLSGMILEEEVEINLSPLDLGRFERGELLFEPACV